MDYNTQMKALILPEYGRNIQNMVNHCLTIEDREERMLCAQTIIKTMGNKFPQFRDEENLKHILWDHLAIMSDFKLDIDYPCEVIKEEEFHVAPQPLPYRNSEIRNRHYGRIVEEMIEHALTLEDGEEREQFIELILVQMKKNYIAWNKDGVEDRKILEDLRIYTKGAIEISDREIMLNPGNNARNNNNNKRNNNNNSKNFKRKF